MKFLGMFLVILCAALLSLVILAYDLRLARELPRLLAGERNRNTRNPKDYAR